MAIDRVRRVTQWLGALLGHGYLMVFVTRAIYQGPLKGLCMPMLSCFACPAAITACPIGTLQHFLTQGQVPWLLLGALVVVGTLFARMTCGWLCPFGLLQDLLYRIPGPKISLPPQLAYVKYGVLVILVVLLPVVTKVPWFSQLCPVGTLTAGIPWMLWDPAGAVGGRPSLASSAGTLFAVKIGILVAFLVLFTAVKRPFCRAACPLGAILSLFGRVSLVRLHVSPACNGCGKCQGLCPVDHKLWEAPDSGECIRCLACTRCRHVQVGIGSPDRAVDPARDPLATE